MGGKRASESIKAGSILYQLFSGRWKSSGRKSSAGRTTSTAYKLRTCKEQNHPKTKSSGAFVGTFETGRSPLSKLAANLQKIAQTNE
ncbi:hypothetical protein EVA_12510 [gut metagenome]|uniref:Uncharacterized protein n=1 Tax=gut metagenome TaxID=749906 RepID=J9GC83_9ZZZZ